MKRLILSFAVLMGAIFCNRIYVFDNFSTGRRTLHFVDQVASGLPRPIYSAGGWPWTFHSRYEYMDGPPLIVWDTSRLLCNIGVWALVLALTYWYFGPTTVRSPKTTAEDELTSPAIATPVNTTKKEKHRRQWRLSDLLVAIFLCALVFGYYSGIKSRHNESRKFISAIQKAKGYVSESSLLPRFYNSIPESYVGQLRKPLMRIEQVLIDSPSNELIRQIVKLPSLRSLAVSGDSYDLKELQPLASLPGLVELRVSGRMLDDSTVRLLGRLKTLQALNVMRTNITADGLAAWGDMPRLRCLHIGHTDVDLSQGSIAPWMKTIRKLTLPRPPEGMGAISKIHDWPELQHLEVVEYDEHMNAEPVELSIARAPKLESIGLDTLQRFKLELSDLPQLSSIENLDYSLTARMPKRSPVPEGLWVRSAKLERLANLSKIKFHIRGFEGIQIEDCPKLKCETEIIGRRSHNEYKGFVDDYSAGLVSAAEVQATLNGVGKSVGLTELALAGLPVKEVSLEPLANCSSLASIGVPRQQVTVAQLKPLSTLPNLVELRFLDGQFTASSPNIWKDLNARELLLALPKLKRVLGDGELLGPIRIESNSEIETLMSGEWLHSNALRLVDVPKLADFVRLSPDLKYLHIERSPSLRGLLTHGPWPEKSSIDRLSNLKHFSAGAPSFRDLHFQSIVDSAAMKSLTLAFTGMTPKGLSEIGRLKQLTALAVTGSDVDDTSIQAWDGIKQLKILMIDQTKITSKSLPWISAQRDLLQLSINTDCLTANSNDPFSTLTLQGLTLTGGEMTPTLVEHISKLQNLRQLRFHNVKFSKEATAKLTEVFSKRNPTRSSSNAIFPESVRALDFRDCFLDQTESTSFFSALPTTTSIGCQGTLLPLGSEQLLTQRPVFIEPKYSILDSIGTTRFKVLGPRSHDMGWQIDVTPPDNQHTAEWLVHPELFERAQ